MAVVLNNQYRIAQSHLLQSLQSIARQVSQTLILQILWNIRRITQHAIRLLLIDAGPFRPSFQHQPQEKTHVPVLHIGPLSKLLLQKSHSRKCQLFDTIDIQTAFFDQCLSLSGEYLWEDYWSILLWIRFEVWNEEGLHGYRARLGLYLQFQVRIQWYHSWLGSKFISSQVFLRCQNPEEDGRAEGMQILNNLWSVRIPVYLVSSGRHKDLLNSQKRDKVPQPIHRILQHQVPRFNAIIFVELRKHHPAAETSKLQLLRVHQGYAFQSLDSVLAWLAKLTRHLIQKRRGTDQPWPGLQRPLGREGWIIANRKLRQLGDNPRPKLPVKLAQMPHPKDRQGDEQSDLPIRRM